MSSTNFNVLFLSKFLVLLLLATPFTEAVAINQHVLADAITVDPGSGTLAARSTPQQAPDSRVQRRGYPSSSKLVRRAKTREQLQRMTLAEVQAYYDKHADKQRKETPHSAAWHKWGKKMSLASTVIYHKQQNGES